MLSGFRRTSWTPWRADGKILGPLANFLGGVALRTRVSRVLSVSAVAVAAMAIAAGPASATDYYHVRLANSFSNYCMGVGSATGNGAHAIQYYCNTASDEKWTIRHLSPDSPYVTVQNDFSGKCLGVGSSVDWNAPLIQYSCTGAADEVWIISNNVFKNHFSGLCMGVASSTTVGDSVIQYKCTDALDEHWPSPDLDQ